MRISARIPAAFAAVVVSSLVLVLVLASSALAGTPATVTVRVVGLTGTTRFPQTQVTTTSTPIAPDGKSADTCSGTSAGGALYGAVQGNWVVKYDGAGLGYEIDGIQGLNFPAFSSNPDAYWALWVNRAPSETGACGQELSPGDDAVFFAQCIAEGTDCPSSRTAPDHFLTETAPASSSVQAGTSVAVTIGSLSTESGKAEPSLPSRVTVTAGSASATPNAQGVATLILSDVGTYTIAATAPDSVPSNPQTICVHNGNDGNCGTTLSGGNGSVGAPGSVSGPSVPSPIQTPKQTDAADVARTAGVKNGHVYSRRSAPRLLAGVVHVPAGGTLRRVRISLERHHRGRCFAFSGLRERFVRLKKCGSAPFLSVGGSESFSYLLPARLPRGRYVYDIEAVNSAGQATKLVSGVSHVAFQVR